MEEEKEMGVEKKRIVLDESVAQSLNERLESTPKTFQEDRPKYILLEKTKALYTCLHPYLELFPRSEKFTLRQKIEEGVLNCIRFLVLQNYSENDKERKKLVLKFLSEIYIIEILIHQSVIFKYISYEGHKKVMSLVREINNLALSRYKNLNKNLKKSGGDI